MFHKNSKSHSLRPAPGQALDPSSAPRGEGLDLGEIKLTHKFINFIKKINNIRKLILLISIILSVIIFSKHEYDIKLNNINILKQRKQLLNKIGSGNIAEHWPGRNHRIRNSKGVTNSELEEAIKELEEATQKIKKMEDSENYLKLKIEIEAAK